MQSRAEANEMTTRIFFDGREYASPEDMPEEARRAYREALGQLADRDGSGVPDVLEGDATADSVGIVHSSVTIDGRTAGVDDLPEPMRRLYETAMADADRNGVPDVLEGGDARLDRGVLHSDLVWQVGAASPDPERSGAATDGLQRVFLAVVVLGIVAVGALLLSKLW